MILFPNAKINLGLAVTEKRTDGYHNIETIMVPVPLKDTLEIIPSENETTLKVEGIQIEGNIKDNLVYRAYELTNRHFDIPNASMLLSKNIPFGAGLGGGSADAAFCLKGLSELFDLNFDYGILFDLASILGADCPFFINNTPAIATGIGDVLEDIELNLNGYYILLIKPQLSVPTPVAYKHIVPKPSSFNLKELNNIDIAEWKNVLYNDFETGIFNQYPELEEIKKWHYENGALYAQMSGSGSVVYGLYTEEPKTANISSDYFCYTAKL